MQAKEENLLDCLGLNNTLDRLLGLLPVFGGSMFLAAPSCGLSISR